MVIHLRAGPTSGVGTRRVKTAGSLPIVSSIPMSRLFLFGRWGRLKVGREVLRVETVLPITPVPMSPVTVTTILITRKGVGRVQLTVIHWTIVGWVMVAETICTMLTRHRETVWRVYVIARCTRHHITHVALK